jgi:3-oxoacyl-[acyl-carrier-protein] synthase II/nodulation protein E
MLTLETEQRARERGAPIYARIAGFGLSSDASHITHPRVEGQAMAMRMALRDAGLAPEQIGYINAHGTGTLLNDRIEAEAIHQVFADRAPHIAVTSTKGLHGHTLGAAGAIEALATVLALHTGQLPGNGAGYATDASLNLNIPAATIRAMPEAALSNSFAFGGLNAALVFMPA